MMPPEVRRLEEITLNTSSALKQALHDGWVLRFSPGSNVKRANSVTALYASSLPIEEKIDYCEAAYAREGLPTRFRITDFCDPPELDDLLAERGYARIEPTIFMILPLTPEATREASPHLAELSLDDWLAVAHELRGDEKETVAAHRARLQSLPCRRFHAAHRVDGKTVCVGLGALLDNGCFGLFDIFTPPLLRNHGYSRSLTRSLLAVARREGAELAFLQVDEGNAPARRIYESFGFRTAYRYWYRVKAN